MGFRPYGIAALALAAALHLPAFGQHEGHGAETAPVAAPKGDPFKRGLYLLHNFEYGTAAAAFRAAQQADPGNAMAYWGEAMTYNHPLWAYQDTNAGRAVLTRLGPDPAARRAKARSPREAMWLDAVVLACTELVMAVDPRANVLPVYDTTEIHARAAVDWMLDPPEDARAAA